MLINQRGSVSLYFLFFLPLFLILFSLVLNHLMKDLKAIKNLKEGTLCLKNLTHLSRKYLKRIPRNNNKIRVAYYAMKASKPLGPKVYLPAKALFKSAVAYQRWTLFKLGQSTMKVSACELNVRLRFLSSFPFKKRLSKKGEAPLKKKRWNFSFSNSPYKFRFKAKLWSQISGKHSLRAILHKRGSLWLSPSFGWES